MTRDNICPIHRTPSEAIPRPDDPTKIVYHCNDPAWATHRWWYITDEDPFP